MVEVEHEHRTPRAVARRVRELAPELLLEAATVEESRQRVVIGEILQLRLEALPLRGVVEGDDGTDDLAPLHDRRADVGDGERRSVPSREELVVNAVDVAVGERAQERAPARVVRLAPRRKPVQRVVDGEAGQMLGSPAEHLRGRRVDEGRAPGGVDAVDPLAGRGQEQLGGAVQPLELLLAPAALDHPS